MIDGCRRKRSLDLVRNPLPDLSSGLTVGENLTQEQKQALLDEIEVRRYAGFAFLIDRMLDGVATVRESSPYYIFPQSPYRDRAKNEFGKLRLDALKVFIECAETLEDTPEYLRLDELAEAKSTLGDSYTYPMGQLVSGSDTAISTSLTLLQNLPSIIEYHAPEYKAPDIARIARDSVGLPYSMAMISINQMMALQATLTNKTLHRSWSNFDMPFDPGYFRLSKDKAGQIKAVKFSNLAHIVVPAGYQYSEEDQPLAKDTLLKDIEPHRPGTIGCPITLLSRVTHRLWSWFIDDIEQKGSWGAT